ncbi:glycosyltransferase [Acetobacterium sp.]|jgi:glycosyltransferase involved in cell wall biosynthesis|uniref:glycosyltransferase n=1 Tax=Acetobacterium sp. TaxID=1872094 RepID=UPI000CAE435A|nr:glycosyltransferase [Acetobacterium sp.]MDO9493748.1 glycosyltransferase [Acetobacterium sp.]PKM75503.1 MAG: glycosyl transferase [Firmicutes bacterium HGW-Firmicutes-17]
MKVLQINSVCGYGSTGRIAVDLYKILEEQGHECLIAYGRGTAPKGINTIKIGTNLDNNMHVIKTRLFDNHGFASIKATKEFIKKSKEYNPDIIHLHNIHGYYINIELLFKYLKEVNKPVIWTLHDCWAFTGHCTYFDYIDCEKWKKGCYECPQKKEYPKSLFREDSKKNYSSKKSIFTGIENLTIVTPSKWLAGLVKDSFLNVYAIKVINNGIDLKMFQPTKSNFRKKYNLINKFIILGVANIWDKRKGYDYFIKLSEKLKHDEIIVLVGLSKKQKSDLPCNILGITRTNSTKELAEIYSNSDIFVNPTLEDNFPTTNLEALACGKYVITFNAGGSGESIDEECGTIVEKGNVSELYDAILEFKNIGVTKNKCINRATLYDKTSRFEEYLNLYFSIE